jgi:hypothetical protein
MANQAAPGQTTPGSDDTAQRARASLAYACTHLNELREELRLTHPGAAAGEPSLLRDLTDAVNAGRPCGPALDAIHSALLDAGDQLGLYGRIDPDWRGLTPTGITVMPPDSDERVYLCPINQCSRHSWPGPDPRPSCAIIGEALREDHI